MKRSCHLFFIAAALVAVTALPVRAQILKDDKPNLRRSEEARKTDAEIDQQFRARRNSNAAPEAKGDPWAGVRNEPAQPAALAKKPAPKTSDKN